jgi:hypothetical protein
MAKGEVVDRWEGCVVGSKSPRFSVQIFRCFQISRYIDCFRINFANSDFAFRSGIPVSFSICPAIVDVPSYYLRHSGISLSLRQIWNGRKFCCRYWRN